MDRGKIRSNRSDLFPLRYGRCTIEGMTERERTSSLLADFATPLQSGLTYSKPSAHPEARFERKAAEELREQLRRIDDALARAYSESRETYVT